MSGYNGMQYWHKYYKPNRAHIERLRGLYLQGTASPEQVAEYLLHAVSDGQELELFKTEVNLRELFKTKIGKN